MKLPKWAIPAGIAVIILLWGITQYNGLVGIQENVNTQWSQVENQYQRRADLIPNLVNVVKGYASHERETLEGVIQARSRATATTIDANNMDEAALQRFQQSQDALSSALSRLMVVVEKYPELKANEQFQSLMAQLEGTENRIATIRRSVSSLPPSSQASQASALAPTSLLRQVARSLLPWTSPSNQSTRLS